VAGGCCRVEVLGSGMFGLTCVATLMILAQIRGECGQFLWRAILFLHELLYLLDSGVARSGLWLLVSKRWDGGFMRNGHWN